MKAIQSVRTKSIKLRFNVTKINAVYIYPLPFVPAIELTKSVPRFRQVTYIHYCIPAPPVAHSNKITIFDVHVSVHLGNVYVRLTVQLDAHYMYSLFLYILFYMFRLLFAAILRSTNCRVQP
jgi:hypothetical protein